MDELPHSMIVNNLNELFVFGTTALITSPLHRDVIMIILAEEADFLSGLGVSFPNGQ